MCLLLAILKHGNSVSTTFCNSSSCFSFLPFSSMATASERLSAPAPHVSLIVVVVRSKTGHFKNMLLRIQRHDISTTRAMPTQQTQLDQQTNTVRPVKKERNTRSTTRCDKTRHDTTIDSQLGTKRKKHHTSNQRQSSATTRDENMPLPETLGGGSQQNSTRNLTRSLTHSLPRSLTHSLTHARTQCRRNNV